MRTTLAVLFMASFALAACGHDEARETTTVVGPPPAQVQQGSTVVVPPGTVTKVCPQGYTTC